MFEQEYREEMDRLHLDGALREALAGDMAQERPARRTRTPVRAALLAAALCGALLVSALAVSPTLRSALEQALGSFAPYSRGVEGVSATDRGIEVRVVSALSDGNITNVYFEVQDKTGDRLDALTEVDGYHITPPEVDWVSAGYGVGTCLGYDPDSRTALFLLRLNGDGAPAKDLTLEVEFSSILPGMERFTVPFPDVELSGETLDSRVLPTGETVLTPGQTPAALEGAGDISLSSYGFASDGKLHQQFRVGQEGVNWEETRIRTFLNSGRHVAGLDDSFARVERYNVDGPGPSVAVFQQDGASYYDVCYGAAPEDAEDVLPHSVEGYLTTGERIDGTWRLEVPLEDVARRSIPLDTAVAGVRAQNLHLTTLGCTIESDPDGNAGTLNYVLTVFLADGSTVPAGRADSTFHAAGYAVNHWSFPEPVDPEQIVGVAIGQWYVPLRGDTAGPGRWLAQPPG